VIEHALKMRAQKEGMKHQKKLDEFLKAVKDITNVNEIKAKFKELLVKSNCLKEGDMFAASYIMLLAGQTPFKEI
jgi:hypothetical protein